MQHPTIAPSQFDELDPHGYAKGHGHHGHHIISAFTLRAVLLALLVLTIATVGQAQLEQYIVHRFDIDLPRWVNVAVVMTIAVIKGCMVALFFMGLKYDNPMNAVILCFTLFAFGLFLGFTMGDLGSRDFVYRYKMGEIQKGGIGNVSRQINGQADTVTGPIVTYVREKKLAELGGDVERFKQIEADVQPHGVAHEEPPVPISTSSHSRPRTGVTDGLFDTANPSGSQAAEGHKAEHKTDHKTTEPKPEH